MIVAEQPGPQEGVASDPAALSSLRARVAAVLCLLPFCFALSCLDSLALYLVASTSATIRRVVITLLEAAG